MQCEQMYITVSQWELDTGLEFVDSLQCPKDAVFGVQLLGVRGGHSHYICGKHTIQWARNQTKNTE